MADYKAHDYHDISVVAFESLRTQALLVDTELAIVQATNERKATTPHSGSGASAAWRAWSGRRRTDNGLVGQTKTWHSPWLRALAGRREARPSLFVDLRGKGALFRC